MFHLVNNNRNQMKKNIILLLLLCFSAYTTIAQTGIPPRPNPPRLVNNLSSTGFLSPGEESSLERKLVDFANQTSNQIVVVIVDDLGGAEPFDYATTLGREWKVGQEKEDNGIVILIKPTGGKGERKYYIAVGRGLEGAIPDITCREIEQNEMVPEFKAGNYYQGLDKATDVLMSLAKGEYNSDAYAAKHKGGISKWKLALMLIAFIIFILISIKRGGRGGNGGMSMGTGFFLGSMMGGGRGFGGGGGSSGGFGGFGGGSFGGGGAGGSW